MAWSTRQLADLAGTTVKAIRYYHAIGLLDEPRRADNGYKEYEVPHLVRVLQVRRFVDLGVPLARIGEMGGPSESLEVLRIVEADTSAALERLQRVGADVRALRTRPPNGDAAERDRDARDLYASMFEVEPATSSGPWSTQELADLAGTTLDAVRHYHRLGLLDDPPRRANGYKKYDASHLQRVRRIRHLVSLGLPLDEIARGARAEELSEPTLASLESEIIEAVARLRRVRDEVRVVVAYAGPPEVPSAFSDLSSQMTDADRALLLVYSRLMTPQRLGELRDLFDEPRSAAQREFDVLDDDADETTRARLAVAFADYQRAVYQRYPWWVEPGAGGPLRPSAVQRLLADSFASVYNTAQMDVLRRIHAIL